MILCEHKRVILGMDGHRLSPSCGCRFVEPPAPVAPPPPTENARAGADEAEAIANSWFEAHSRTEQKPHHVLLAIQGAAREAFRAGRARGIGEERAKRRCCENDPCPICGDGPSGEWYDGSEVTCDGCGAELFVSGRCDAKGCSSFEAIEDHPNTIAARKAIADAIAKETPDEKA